MGGELDLQSLLGTKVAEQNADKGALSLGNLVSGADSQATRERQARTDSFKQLLSSPSTLSGPSDPINLHPDFTRQPLNPIMPSAAGNLGPQTFGNNFFTPRPNPATPNNSLNSFGSPDLNSRLSQGLGTPTPAQGAWKPTEVQWRGRPF